MSYILTFCAGGFLGYIIAAILASGGYAEKIQEAYEEGYKRGFNRGSNQRN